MDASREKLLNDLVTFARPLDDVYSQLRRFPWDCQEELVQLREGHVIDILQRYLETTLTAKDVEEWADALEVRDDVEFAPSPEESVHEAINFLANPLLHGPLTPDSARRWMSRLGK